MGTKKRLTMSEEAKKYLERNDIHEDDEIAIHDETGINWLAEHLEAYHQERNKKVFSALQHISDTMDLVEAMKSAIASTLPQPKAGGIPPKESGTGKMEEKDKHQLLIEIEHVFNSGANHVRMLNSMTLFIEQTYLNHDN